MCARKLMLRVCRIQVEEPAGEGLSHRKWRECPLAWRDYVEEDQEEKSQDASLEGQPR
jgi:hypothetical protein